MTRPNILVVMADQLAPQFTGAYGHPVVQTPHLDALAARGMRFDAAYCNSPLCAPSRFAFMTGQHITRHGAYDNAAEFKASVPTFAHHLRALGYKTCLSGRMHFVGPDQKHGFEERLTTDIYPGDFAWTPNWEDHETRIDSWYHNMDTVAESGPAAATFVLDYDDEVSFAANRWLIDHARRRAQGEDAPFALVASFFSPHDPYVARQDYWDRYEDVDIDLPQHAPDPDTLDPFARRVLDGIGAADLPMTPDQTRAARRAYYANVTYIDDQIGKLVHTLEATGALDNTVIVVTSDHGDMLGERGLWFKMTYFEHSARVPLIMAGPGVAHGTAPNACSLIDLLPTFAEIAGAEPDSLAGPLDGRSLLPLARGEADPVDEAIGEYCAEMTPYPVFMIRRGPLKLIYSAIDPPQLYDVAADPLETINLATDPAYASQCEAFVAEATTRWDSEAIRADVIASQRARFTLLEGMAKGAPEHWDYNPPRDASQQYVRNHMDWEVAANYYRFPKPDEPNA